MNENQNASLNVGGKNNSIKSKTIIAPVKTGNFAIDDFKNSGISDEVINEYINKGYLKNLQDGWELTYPKLYEDAKSDYTTKRLEKPKTKNKYIRPPGKPSQIFRPLGLSPEKILDKNEYLILTEGEKKAIKAVQEGFNCVSLGGVWCWKMTPKEEDKELEPDAENTVDEDIIPDIDTADFKNKLLYLCYDNDLWEKEQVKCALYQFAAYLVGEKKARVRLIKLPYKEEK